MRLVEIRLANGLLLIGPPGAFDNVILRAGDQLQAQGILRLLARDMSAQAQLRRHWPALFPRNDHGATDWPEMQHLLAQKIASRQLLLILLSEVEPSIEPAHLPDIRTHLVNLPLGDRTLLITGPGLMPPPFLQFESTTAAIDELRRIPAISSAMHLLEAQAGRLPGGNIKGLRGENLRGHLMWKLSRGALTGAVLHQPMARTQASSRADAPRPVSGMDRGERIAEAMSRSRNYLSGEILEVVEEMVTPQNLAIMAGVFLAVAIANLFPILGAAVDTTLLAIVVATIGITGAIAVGELVSAIASAMNAESEDELDAAAREFASAFVALGALALQAILAKFVKRSGGKGEAGASAPKNKAGGSRNSHKSPSPKKPSQEAREPQPRGKGSLGKSALETKPGEATFWSGIGRGGDKKAAGIARRNGGKTMEDIMLERGIDMPEWDADNPASVKAWKDASRMFAEGAKGDVKVVLGDQVRPDGIWNSIELPTLQNNPNVTSITAIDPNTGKQVLLYSRGIGP
ncbi:MAG: hypothetical protein R3D83_04050 [Caenibius sp.]